MPLTCCSALDALASPGIITDPSVVCNVDSRVTLQLCDSSARKGNLDGRTHSTSAQGVAKVAKALSDVLELQSATELRVRK